MGLSGRKRAESALGDSEERFRRTFELAASGLAHIGLDRRFIRVNRRLCEILGYSEQELLGLTGREISHPDDLDMINAQRPRLYAGEIDAKITGLSTAEINATLRKYVRPDAFVEVYAGDFAKKK